MSAFWGCLLLLALLWLHGKRLRVKGGNVQQTDTQRAKSKGRDHCCARGRKGKFTMQTLGIPTGKHLQAVTRPIPLALGCSETVQGASAKVLNLLSQESYSGLCNLMSSKCTFSSTRRRLNHEPGAVPKNSSPKHKGFWLYSTFTAFCGVSLGSLCLQISRFAFF